MVAEKLYIVPVCIYLILSGNFVFLTLQIAYSCPLLIFLPGAHFVELESESSLNGRYAVTDIGRPLINVDKQLCCMSCTNLI